MTRTAKQTARAGTKRKRYASVWDAIEPTRAQAASMKARAEAMIAIRAAVERWGVTQAVAARRLKLTQPRMNDLLRGRISKFSLDALIDLATRAGLAVRVEVRKAA
jgi:predicted XRE-type DNA-binding protein